MDPDTDRFYWYRKHIEKPELPENCKISMSDLNLLAGLSRGELKCVSTDVVTVDMSKNNNENCSICLESMNQPCSNCFHRKANDATELFHDPVLQTEGTDRSRCLVAVGQCGHAFHYHCLKPLESFTKEKCVLCARTWSITETHSVYSWSADESN